LADDQQAQGSSLDQPPHQWGSPPPPPPPPPRQPEEPPAAAQEPVADARIPGTEKAGSEPQQPEQPPADRPGTSPYGPSPQLPIAQQPAPTQHTQQPTQKPSRSRGELNMWGSPPVRNPQRNQPPPHLAPSTPQPAPQDQTPSAPRPPQQSRGPWGPPPQGTGPSGSPQYEGPLPAGASPQQSPAPWSPPPHQSWFPAPPQHEPHPWGSPPDGPGDPARQSPAVPRSRTPRLVAALATLVAAVLVTTWTVHWTWSRADALTPVDLPSAGKPLETVDPQGFLEPKVADGKMVNTLGDTMPLMPAPPWGQSSDPITYRGLGFWMDVHVKYDGTNTWGNAVFFGIFHPEEPYTSTPAGIRKTATLVGGRILNRIYDAKVVPIKSTVKHRPITVDGHRAHEITARVPIKQAQLAETFSTLGMIVIDRGDGTAAVSATVISGSTTAKWLPIWREHVAQIKIRS
jgi:hypothetical protein